MFESTAPPTIWCGDLWEETVGEMKEVIDACLEKNVSVHARVIHRDVVRDRELLAEDARKPLLNMINYQESLKRQGSAIHTSWNLLDYQKTLLNGEDLEWSCIGGYKYFFVSSQGKFWLCSQIRTERDIMDITVEDLRAYNKAKQCQKECGVYCIVDMSLAVNRPVAYLSREASGRWQGLVGRLRNKGNAASHLSAGTFK